MCNKDTTAHAAEANNLECYEVVVSRTDYLYCRMIVQAASQEQAEHDALQLAELQDDNAWKFADRDLSVLEVNPSLEGQNNE